ncbi:transcriptional repressor TraM, partial [Aquimarina algiphila]|uniref:transcriptional repressor TraM n=1 Tax=Aquimarina algiphila TaxID=2047982 RepID=UPI00232ADF60
QLTIQRLSIENRKLQERLEEISKNNQETLNGVHHKVHSLLQEELQKRDFEDLKKSHSQCEGQVKELEEALKKAKKETEAKQQEIEALVKKLGFVELGKAL